MNVNNLLCRAKSVLTREFAYGYVVAYNNGRMWLTREEGNEIISEEVCRKTCDLYLGIKDVHGERIFGRDILKLTMIDGDSCCGNTIEKFFSIFWDDKTLSFRMIRCGNFVLCDPEGMTWDAGALNSNIIERIEVIGNLIDNPHGKGLDLPEGIEIRGVYE